MNETVGGNGDFFNTLTSRESDILALLCDGLSDQEIADRLVIAYTTVKWYNRQIFNKLGVDNRRQAIQRAKTRHLLEIQPTPDPTSAPATAKSGLPVQTTPFVGRQRELNELVALITQRESRLLTILGPGGMGKSRLSLSAGEVLLPNFPDGVFFVPLAPVIVPDNVLSTIAEYTGFQFASDHRSPRQQVLDFLANKDLLLILDNFEHVLDAASLVTDILQSAPRITMLITSRERLNLSGETVYLLTGMDYPETIVEDNFATYSALQLFDQRARRAHAGFALSADLLAVAEICRLVQGMPLAIELAAAWTSALSTTEIAEEISRSLDFLQTSMRDVPERQRSVRAVFDSTWKRLSEAEQSVFRKLSVFRGGFTREAAQAIAQADLQTLTGLVNKALLWRVADTRRYHIHELLRQYAKQQLEAAHESPAISEAHSRYYLNALHHWEPNLKGAGQIQALEDVEQDMENIHVAWGWGASHYDFEALYPSLRPIWLYYLLRGQCIEGVVAYEQATNALRPAPPSPEKNTVLGLLMAYEAFLRSDLSQKEPVLKLLDESRLLLAASPESQAFLLLTEGWPIWAWKPQAETRPLLKSALEHYRQAGDQWGIAVTLYALAMSYLGGGTLQEMFNLSEANKLMAEAAAMLQKSGDLHFHARVLKMQGLAASFVKDYEEADRLTFAALELNRQIGNIARISGDLNNLSLYALFRCQLDTADHYLEESLALGRQTGSPWGMAIALNNLINNAIMSGRYQRAETFANELYAIALQSGAPHIFNQALAGLSSTLWPQGRFQEAENYLRQQISLSEAENEIEERCLSLLLLSDIYMAQGNFETAHRLLDEVTQLAPEAENTVITAMRRKNRGVLLSEQGDYTQANVLLHKSLDFFRSELAGQVMSYDWAAEQVAINLVALGVLERLQGHLETAREHFVEGVAIAQTMPHKPPLKLMLLTGIASLLAANDQPERAVRMAAMVQAHPASYAINKMRAGKLLEKLQTQLPAVEQSQAHSIDELVADFLASP